jgi:hypothetical protein
MKHEEIESVEVIQALLTALYAMMEHCYDPDRDDDIVKAYKLARDAIGKAEGFK